MYSSTSIPSKSDIPPGLNFSSPSMQTQGLPIAVNDYGDSVDGTVAAALAPPQPPPLPYSPSCDGLVDLTVNSRRCFYLSSGHFEDRSSFNSVPQLSMLPLLSPPPPPLPLLSVNASAGNLAEQISVGRSEEESGSSGPHSGCDMGISDTNAPLDLSTKPRTASPDIPEFHLISIGVSHSRRLLKKVEKFIDAAVNLFASPSDLYTSPQNIPQRNAVEEAAGASAAVLGKRLREVVAAVTTDKKVEEQATGAEVMNPPIMPFSLSEFYGSLPLAEPSFSPVLRHLLSLPEWKALAFLRYPTARGKELADHLAVIYKDLTRCKRKLKQLNLVLRRRAANGQLAAPRTVKSPPLPPPPVPPKPQEPLFPNTYTDPNTCPLSLLSMVVDQRATEPNSPSQVLQMSPLSVDTETLAETVKVFPLSDIGPRAWANTPPPPPPLQALGSITMRNRSFSFPKRPATPLTTPSVDRRKMKAPMVSGTTTGVWPPKRRRSEVSRKPRCASESVDFCEVVSDISTSPLRLHEQLTIQVRDTVDPQQSGSSAHHSAKTTASISPSTSSLATVDTSSVSSHRPPQRRPPPPQRTSTTSSRRQRKTSLGHFAGPPMAYKGPKPDEAEEGLEDELLQRPPTPDLRRIDLDLSDLSDGLRVLLIEDTHLRAGTLYLEDTSTSYSNERDNTHDRQCLIRLDQLEKVESPPPLRLSPGTSNSVGSSSASLFTVGVKRRRLGEVRLHAWQVLQQAVLEVVPVSISQLPPGTRVCAAWSDTLAINLYPGVISELGADKLPPADNHLCIDFDDGDHREVPLHHIRMLPDHFANLTELGRATDAPISCTVNTGSMEARCGQASPQPSPVSPKCRRMTSVTRRSQLVNGDISSLKEPSPLVHGDDWLNDWPTDGEKVKAPLRVIWKPHGRLRKRYNGMPCYRSLKRNRDGLVVRLGDVVKFNSGGSDQAYLGEIKFICAPRHNELSPLVCASWFYCPEEAGEDARNYAEYRLSRQKKAAELTEKQPFPCGDEITSVLDESEGDSSSEGELPTYFIAGKFDPLTGRVLAWDPDLSTELHLQVSSSPPSQHPSAPPTPTSRLH
ncbi:BAH and coiled-coil domain-containing protein 1 [Taenia crassiceps]|uniref:BAH and coiled-coil domain-containing protein 1 n=1 Tax=Taenia crassiceps TaxID=6207 RepID=A0ABR4Q967_9CEST